MAATSVCHWRGIHGFFTRRRNNARIVKLRMYDNLFGWFLLVGRVGACMGAVVSAADQLLARPAAN